MLQCCTLVKTTKRGRPELPGRPLLGGVVFFVCRGFEAQVVLKMPLRGPKKMFPRDGVLFLLALEGDNGILRAAFDDDLALLSVYRD